MLFISGLSIAQQNRWVVRSVIPEGDQSYSQSVNRLLTQRTDNDICHPGFNIGEVLSYVQLNATADNVVQIGTNPNALVSYTGVGNWREGVSVWRQRGWYSYFVTRPAGIDIINWNQISGQGDPINCSNDLTDVQATISGSDEDDEILAIRYRVRDRDNLRITIRNELYDSNVNINGSSNPHVFDANGLGTRSIRVPKRRSGDIYTIRVAFDNDLDNYEETTLQIVNGIRVESIDRYGINFIVADRGNTGTDNIRLDRVHRGDDTSRNQNSFDTASQRFSRAGGRVRAYVSHYDGKLRAYEAVRIVARRGGNERTYIQLNGPTIEFTWFNRGVSNRDNVNLNLHWKLILPPGWSKTRLTNRGIRFFSNDGYRPFAIAATTTTRYRNVSNVDTFIQGSLNNFNLWQYMDNNWEVGVNFDYNGLNYRIKIVDHVGHGNGRPERTDYRGGARTGHSGRVTNFNEVGGSHSGSITWNRNWAGCTTGCDGDSGFYN